MNQKLSFLREPLIAHRGMYNEASGIPENSIKAFELAISYGYSIELDLHVLKDDTVIVFHDDNLNRMTGVNKDLKNLTYSDIKDLRLQNTNYHIPLFKDVLGLVNR